MRRSLLSLGALAVVLAPARADDWPQWHGPKRDGVWRETGILDKFPAGGPKVRWRVPVGAGYSGPAVADGRVYVTDRVLGDGAASPADPFTASRVKGKERVHCIDDANGKVLWTHAYDCEYAVSYAAGPRATPLVSGGKVYALGTMGDLFCLATQSGKEVWSKNFRKEYSAPTQQWGFSASPLLDGDKLICVAGGKGSAVVALHKDTGKELWRALSVKTGAGYCPPVIYDVAGKRQLIIWTGDGVSSLDPENGSQYWFVDFQTRKPVLSIPMPRLAGDLLFITSFYDGPLMLKLDTDKPGAKVLWKGKGRGEQPDQTDGLHSIMPTPVIQDGHIYGVCSYGELRCLKAETGERVWEEMRATTPDGKKTRWANAFLVPNGDRYFLFNEKGDLIIAKLSPKGYQEIDRANLIKPTNPDVRRSRPGHADGGLVLWSHPAFANKSVYARNDKELVCVSLAAGQ